LVAAGIVIGKIDEIVNAALVYRYWTVPSAALEQRNAHKYQNDHQNDVFLDLALHLSAHF